MRVVFRADATRSSGTGHIMRCWALAEEMCALGAMVAWQGDIEVPWVRRALDEMSWSVYPPHGSPAEQARRVAADLVVVDSYTLDNAYRDELMDLGTAVVAIIDDSVSTPGSASLWVNPGAQVELPLPEGSPYLNGPDYALIRRNVRQLRLDRQDALRSEGLRSGGIHGLTVMLGGTDFAGIGALLRTSAMPRLRDGMVFAGPGSWESGGGITWIEGGADLLVRAALSRLVVSAAGVSSWELAHIGVPMALIQVADNQSGNYEWMTQQGWAWPLGPLGREGTETLADQLSDVLDALDRGDFDGRSRIDGLGAQRVAARALELI